MSDIEERLAAKTDLAVAGGIQVSPAVGGIKFQGMSEVMEFAKLMAVSRQAVPKHLRGEAGACLAISLQALNWRMDPFAVANKSYMVNDRIAYEAQLIHAVIEQRAPIKGRIKGEVSGQGDTRRWTLSVADLHGEIITYEGPEFGKITTKNSPLWKADPDQQLWYYSVRAMCRRHFPDVILGVYERDEIQADQAMRDVTPDEKPNGFQAVIQRRQAEVAPPVEQPSDIDPPITGEVMDDGHWTDHVKLDDAFPGSDAYTEGAKAAENTAKSLRDCPYEKDTQEAVDWCGGFDGKRGAMA